MQNFQKYIFDFASTTYESAAKNHICAKEKSRLN